MSSPSPVPPHDAQALTGMILHASHDLRAPTRSIQANASILRNEHADAMAIEALDCLAGINEASRDIGQIVDNLVRYVTLPLQPSQFVRTEIAHLAAEAVAQLRSDGSQEGLEFDLKLSSTVRGDPAMLRDLFVAVISNAIKSVAAVEHGRVEVWEEPSGDAVRICIRDSGIGFDPKYADRALLPFEKLHSRRAFPGSGLGLAIASLIAQRHGGKLWLQSEPNVGTCAFVELPGA